MEPAGTKTQPPAPIVVKKYANRRLYDTSASAYVTLGDLGRRVRQGSDFVVQDARTGEDLTRQVLTQIIVEEESRGESLLPIPFLRQLIGFYGGGGGGPSLLPSYLAMSLEAFARQQAALRETLGPAPATEYFEARVRRNLALFERAMTLFAPPSGPPPQPEPEPEPEPEPAPGDPDASQAELRELKRRVEALSREIDRLSTRP